MLQFLLKSSLIIAASWGRPDVYTEIRRLQEEKKSAEIVKITQAELPKAATDTDRALLLMSQGLAQIELRNLQEAQSAFEMILTYNTNLKEYAHFYLGKINHEQNNFEIAKFNWTRVIALSPNIKLETESRFRLALLENELGNFKKARDYLVHLEKRQKNEEGYPEVLFQMARAERGLGNHTQFCKRVRKLFSKYPDFYRITDWSVNLPLNQVDGRPTKCVNEFDELRSRIRNLQWAGQIKKAKDEITAFKALNAETDSLASQRLAVYFHLHEGEVEEALSLLKPYFEKYRHDPNYLLSLATVLVRAGDAPAAVGSYYQAYKLNPKSKRGKEALFQAAFLSYQFQDYDGASRKFREFIKNFSSSGLSRDAKWHLAWIRYLRGDYQGASEAFEDLSQPTYTRRRKKRAVSGLDRIQYWRAMSLFRLEKFDQARKIFDALAHEKSLGYYAIAAEQRLKKLEVYFPKAIHRGLAEGAHRLKRFSVTEVLLPVDEWLNPSAQIVPEESETEENLNLSNLAEETTVDPDAEADPEAENEEGATNGDMIASKNGDEESEDDEPMQFSQPVLVKRFERARDLMILGLNDWAKWDLYDIERKTRNREYLKTLMGEFEKVDHFHRSSYIAQVVFGRQRAEFGIEGVRYLWEYAYPQAYGKFVKQYSSTFDVPQELIWGIMRAESTYRKDVVSPAGAMGLMQVMPQTGRRVSSLLNEANFDARILMEPDPAIRIGSKYLQRLYKKFERNFALVAASYNAGPHRVKQWLSSFGTLEMDEFVEHIPFVETRNYVKRVLSNMTVYSKLYRLTKELPISLTEPLSIRFKDRPPFKESWEEI